MYSIWYFQPRALFNLMSAEQKQLLFDNTARQIGGAEEFIQARHIVNCYKVDPAYGRGVADALGLDIDKILSESESMSEKGSPA